MADSKLPIDFPARLAIWRQLGWEELSDADTDIVWKRFERSFGFFGIGIREPTPSLAWDITLAFQRDQAFLDHLAADLNSKVLRALQLCTDPGERVYALDWMHTCYWFDPHAGVAGGAPDEWAVPVLPDGDHYVFMAADLRFAIIGHMDTSVCVFGRRLLDALAGDPPAAFIRLLRQDGLPA